MPRGRRHARGRERRVGRRRMEKRERRRVRASWKALVERIRKRRGR